ncbi:MAG: hypothetical protein VCC00_13515 [Deltaproteobacteria bacterium]
MTEFARCFLLVLCQSAVGGLLSLAVPPFRSVERGFFKSTGTIYFIFALLGAGGTIYLYFTRPESTISPFEVALWIAFLPVMGLYVSTLWGEAELARARLFPLALLLGFLGLAVSAVALSHQFGVLVSILAILTSFAGAGVLGGVWTGMWFGHWYLIDIDMDIEPFRNCFRFFVGTLLLETGILAVAATTLVFIGDGNFLGHGNVVLLRALLGPLPALVIGFLVYRVLQIPQTMAATGLFYIELIFVLTGAFIGRYFTFTTGFPL